MPIQVSCDSCGSEKVQARRNIRYFPTTKEDVQVKLVIQKLNKELAEDTVFCNDCIVKFITA